MYQLIIKNGKIIDGTGSPAFRADLAVADGKIVRIGRGLSGAETVIDADGLVVTPGFIDSHSHSDNSVLTYPDQLEKIEQGITCSIGGQCGDSPAPLSRDFRPEDDAELGSFGKYSDIYRTTGSFFKALEPVALGSSIAGFVGHNALRRAVMGMENRPPSAEELEKMKALLREGLEHGALGVSFGLIYPPSCYADTEELIALARVAGEYHAMVAAHIRNEGDTLVRATEEFISVIRASGVRGVLSHHKAAGKGNWGKVSHTLRMLEEANASGTEIYCDVYPYNAFHTSLSATFIPKPLHSGGNDGLVQVLSDPQKRSEIKEWNYALHGKGDLSWVQVAICAAYPEYEGLLVSEVAKRRGTDDYDAVFDMIRDSRNVCSGCFFTMCEEDIRTVMAYPRTMICTDSSVAQANKVYHPRLRGTFPRVLGRYVREQQVTTLPEMIRKITAMPAAVYGLRGKGLLREGFDADICIFNPDTITDCATYADCSQRAKGLHYVLLGGEVVAENAVFNGKRKGRLILRNEA